MNFSHDTPFATASFYPTSFYPAKAVANRPWRFKCWLILFLPVFRARELFQNPDSGKRSKQRLVFCRNWR
jgi:hypothetical protein